MLLSSQRNVSSTSGDSTAGKDAPSFDEDKPLAIILVSSGSKGDRLLFRYPFEPVQNAEVTVTASARNNPYSSQIAEDFESYSSLKRSTPCIQKGVLVGYCDKTLANLLAVKSDLCGKRFELKIDDIRFVGFPSVLHSHSTIVQGQGSSKRPLPTMISFNVAFALHANATQSIVRCYQELAKQLAIALRHEERRVGYITKQKNHIIAIQDEASTMPEDVMESPYPQILQKCQLAKHMKQIYQDLSETGVVILRINKWIEVNYCMPFKVHQKLSANIKIEPDAIQRCISGLRPYHAILLLEEEGQLLDSLPPDSSPALVRLIRVASPVKKLEQLALDADLALSQIFQLVSHLLYWAKAMIIYPLCESNVYMLSPNADTILSSDRVEEFTKAFPGMSLSAFLSEFSLPAPYGEHKDVMGHPQQQVEHVQMVVWLLQHQLLMQLHTYIYLNVAMPTGNHSRAPSQASDDSDNNIQKQSSYSSDIGSVSDVGSPGTSFTSQNSLTAITVPTSKESGNADLRTGWARTQEHLLPNLTVIERQAVLAVPAANNMDDLKLFGRLCPYFNGKHHLEDIMFYENLRRSQLLTLMDKFRSVLLTCVHEDPVTAFHISCTKKSNTNKKKK